MKCCALALSFFLLQLAPPPRASAASPKPQQAEGGNSAAPAKPPLGLSCAPNNACETNPSPAEFQFLLPVFLVDKNYKSTAVVVNSNSVPTYVDVTVHDSNGIVAAQQRINIAAHDHVQIDIGELLESSHSSATAGSVQISPAADSSGTGVIGQMSIAYSGSQQPSYLEYEPARPGPSSSLVLRAVADEGEGSPVVGITSTATSAQNVTIQCFGASGPAFSKTVAIPALGTFVTKACDNVGGDPLAVESTPSQGSAAAPQARGISLTSDAPPGSFAAAGFAKHVTENGTFLTAVPFSDPKGAQTSTTIFPGLPVGHATQLPGGNYVPVLSAANFSTSPARLTIKYSRTTGDTPEFATVTTLLVPAGGTATTKLEGLQGDSDLQNSFEVVSDQGPGDVVDNIASNSDTGILWVELPGKDLQNSHNSGNHPWTVADGTDSTILLFNETAAAENFTVRVASGQAVWIKKYTLAALATKAIDVNELIADQVKDDNGYALPSGLESGQANWVAAQPFGGTGRLLQSNPAQYAARSFSCGEYSPIVGGIWYPDVTSEAVGQTNTFGQLEAETSEVEVRECIGTPVYDVESDDYTWTSGSPSIAAISGTSSGDYLYEVPVEGLLAGSATISVTVEDQYGCEYTQNVQETVTPGITSISPSQGLVGTAMSGVTITGTGFASGATVYAGPNISVSDVVVTPPTQITATFMPSNSASAGGNQGVTVTVSGQTSPSKNFYVQVPKHIAYITTSSTPISPNQSTPVTGTSISIVQLGYGTIAVGACGGYEWFTYQLMDQETSPQRIQNGTVNWFESFSNLVPSTPPWSGAASPGQAFSIDLSNTVLGDTYDIYAKPGCPSINSTLTFKQAWTPNVGGTLSGTSVTGGVNYPLTTVISGSESTNGAGIPSFSASISTP